MLERIALVAALVLGFAPAPLFGSTDQQAFDAANRLYDEGHFTEARDAYQTLVTSGQYSANVFYNLGNAEFRLNVPGAAALQFERALALKPAHPEARANLDLVRENTGAKVEPRTWLDHLLISLPPDVWGIIAAVAGWTMIFGIALLVFGVRRAGRRSMGVPLLGAAALAYSGLGLWRQEADASLAIVVVNRAEARMGPAESAGMADTLAAGSRIHIVSDRRSGKWLDCVLPNGQRAWIDASAVERVALPRS
jgi:tetratricopeptide (TPR) repeat protein